MDRSLGSGLMAVFAVSGSVAFLAAQFHKRLLSNFMKQMESQFKGAANIVEPKKKVRFADDVTEYSVSGEWVQVRVQEFCDVDACSRLKRNVGGFSPELAGIVQRDFAK